MKSATVRFVFDRKKSAGEGEGPIQLEIYNNRQRKWYSTGLKVRKEQWDDKSWVVNHPDSFNKNKTLADMLKAANDEIRRQFEQYKDFSFEMFSKFMNGNGSIKATDALYELVEQYYSHLEISQSRRVSVNSLKRHLDAFGKIKLIADLTYFNMIEFRSYLLKECDLQESTAAQYLGILKGFSNHLYKMRLIDSDPFEGIHLRKGLGNSKIKYLKEDELFKFRDYPLKKPAELYIRDVFMFQAYTGMSHCDVMRLSISDISEENGRYILRKTRQKTGVQYSIAILKPAYDILVKYGGTLNRYTTSYTDAVLKDLGLTILGKKISSHWSRHSFATYSLSQGIPIEYVSHMLGHSNVKMTQRYARVLDLDVLDQFSKLENAFNDKGKR